MSNTDTSVNFDHLNDLADMVHWNATNKGFYDKPETDDQYIGRAMMNIVGECAEFWEGSRRNQLDLPCDKAPKMIEMGLPGLTCKEEELADIIIRALDTAKRLNVNIGKAVWAKHEYNKTRAYRHGGKTA